MFIYLIDRVLRWKQSSYATEIVGINIKPGVLNLSIAKPRSFKFKSGQYAFINSPDISHIERHPFTITSSPLQDHVTFHIKTSGDWTKKFSQLCSSALPEDITPLPLKLQSASTTISKEATTKQSVNSKQCEQPTEREKISSVCSSADNSVSTVERLINNELLFISSIQDPRKAPKFQAIMRELTKSPMFIKRQSLETPTAIIKRQSYCLAIDSASEFVRSDSLISESLSGESVSVNVGNSNNNTNDLVINACKSISSRNDINTSSSDDDSDESDDDERGASRSQSIPSLAQKEPTTPKSLRFPTAQYLNDMTLPKIYVSVQL